MYVSHYNIFILYFNKKLNDNHAFVDLIELNIII